MPELQDAIGAEEFSNCTLATLHVPDGDSKPFRHFSVGFPLLQRTEYLSVVPGQIFGTHASGLCLLRSARSRHSSDHLPKTRQQGRCTVSPRHAHVGAGLSRQGWRKSRLKRGSGKDSGVRTLRTQPPNWRITGTGGTDKHDVWLILNQIGRCILVRRRAPHYGEVVHRSHEKQKALANRRVGLDDVDRKRHKKRVVAIKRDACTSSPL